MISIEEHVKNTIKLTNSLVIKMLDYALAINKGLILEHGMSIPSDKRQWKYFMNLAGEKHETNGEVMITVIELSEKRALTLELLQTYDYTREELLKCEALYDEVVTTYPDETLYIHGCMYPVAKERAIMAKDGEILEYNKNFVEEYEYDLIKDLQKFIYNFIQRWHVNAYTLTDHLYLPYIMGVLYASIPSKIINLRLNNIGSNQVNSFHLEHFFRSNINLWEETNFLKPKTIYWLYKNLPYLVNNLGKDEVLKTVIDKILTDNDIGIGSYWLRTPNLTIDSQAFEVNPEARAGEVIKSDITKPIFTIPELVATIEPINSIFTNSNEKFTSIGDIVSREISIGTNDLLKENVDKIEQHKIDARKAVAGNANDRQKTKMLELSTYELFKRNGIDLFKFVFDYWIYLAINNKLNFVAEYIEPNDKKNYVNNPKIGILFLLKILLKLTGQSDLRLKELKYDVILPTNKNAFNQAKSALYDDGYLDTIIALMQDGYPNLNMGVTTVMQFTEHLTSIINYYTYVWTLDANLENATSSANVKRLLALTTQKGTHKLTDDPNGKTIDELLAEENIIYITEDTYDFKESLQACVEAYTGISIDEYKFIKEISDSFKGILEKLISYTTQVLNTTTTEDALFIHYNNNRLYRPKKGIINLRQMDFFPLEKFSGLLGAIGNDFKDSGVTTHRNTTHVEAKTLDTKPSIMHLMPLDDIDIILSAPVSRVRVIE